MNKIDLTNFLHRKRACPGEKEDFYISLQKSRPGFAVTWQVLLVGKNKKRSPGQPLLGTNRSLKLRLTARFLSLYRLSSSSAFLAIIVLPRMSSSSFTMARLQRTWHLSAPPPARAGRAPPCNLLSAGGHRCQRPRSDRLWTRSSFSSTIEGFSALQLGRNRGAVRPAGRI